MKILVDKKADKEKILKESEHLHSMKDLDTDTVSVLSHIHLMPEIVIREGDFIARWILIMSASFVCGNFVMWMLLAVFG